MWVQGRYGAADPIDSVRTAASASSSPALAVTDIRVPTSRHTALLRTASATPGWPITPVTPSDDDAPRPGDPLTSFASGTVATRARSAVRSSSNSARASSRATCSPAMIVTGPRARCSARAIGCGSPGRRSNGSATAPLMSAPLASTWLCWTFFGSNSTAGPPARAAATASGSAVTMSAGVSTRRQ